MKWEFATLSEGTVGLEHFGLFQSGNPVSYSEVISLWQNDQRFRRLFADLLSSSKFKAFRWETPPLTSANLGRPFEFVLLQSDMLDRPVNARAFSEHWKEESAVVTFENLGGDATLVVPVHPVNQNNLSNYGHLASFVRHAGEQQVDHLWSAVGGAMQSRVNNSAIWLSTAGMGISWLHIRLDSRPKYYGYSPYRKMLGNELV